MQAAGVVEHTSRLHVQIAQCPQCSASCIAGSGRLQAQIARRNNLCCVVEGATGGQHHVLPGLGNTGQRQCASAANLQVTGGIERTTAVDGLPVQGDAAAALHDGIDAGGNRPGGERSRCAAGCLTSDGQGTLRAQIERGCGLQGAGGSEIAPSLECDGLGLERAGLLQVGCCSSLQGGCRSDHARQLHFAQAVQADSGTLTAQLAAAAQRAGINA
nr:hypothetical protein [Xanthomonas campestris]